ncbi:hypothetical protein PoB_006358200 [Plakobranchus ocellatus]|uniref:Uncharacterized protein n=1 Tax=Plakobranchus ocellatus TaxID=259542 RepID=A0AAV4CYU3_9GAST|nr:hypothetical protein PoB_006358200 [Plakobranchus ocellatus]
MQSKRGLPSRKFWILTEVGKIRSCVWLTDYVLCDKSVIVRRGGAVDNESAPRSAVTLLTRVREIVFIFLVNTMDPFRSWVHTKVISGFQALRQDRTSVTGLEPETEGFLQISGRVRYPLCRQRPSSLYDVNAVCRF